jgi:hydrogenase maturation protein HypF
MYRVDWDDLLVVHDLHPQYASTSHALELSSTRKRPVQHHCAHIASVLAEREVWDERVIGVSFDGTGYGEDGTIWGGEFFAGSLAEGFRRVMHLRTTWLPGGDAAARHPVQCAAGFLSQIDDLPKLDEPPFQFPNRYRIAKHLADKRVRTFETTSAARLFDACAALLGFHREISFEGQAAIWLEHLARAGDISGGYPFPITGETLDFRPLLAAVAEDRLRRRNPADIARAFHKGVARGLCEAVTMLCGVHGVSTAVLSGGVFQNDLLLTEVKSLLAPEPIRILTNAAVPPNDGGISLGQAAIATSPMMEAHKYEPSGAATNLEVVRRGNTQRAH